MIGPHLSRLQREADQILERIRRLEEISVPDVAKLLNKTPRWVRNNFPIIVHNQRTHSVRVTDIEAYQERRTIAPESGVFGKKAA